MSRILRDALLILLLSTFINDNEAVAPLFLQAITSALGTIPFTAGPMTTGLMGAKLAVGSKLLYYLGLFGRRRSKPKSTAAITSGKQRFGSPGGSQFSGGMQAVPLPYAFGGGGGGFPQQFGGMDQPSFYNQYPYGYDPAQLFQMLAAQGIDPVSAMQAMNMGGGGGMNMGGGAMNMGGGGGGQAIPSSQFPFSAGAGAGSFASGGGGGGRPENPSLQQQQPTSAAGSQGGEQSDNDVESFFTFLRDMDDNTCISRLICDIGSNPAFLGDFSENIYGIISSLDVKPTSGAFQYISIMESGKREGGCSQKFPQCGDVAYEVVKNIAPTVGVPQNINSEAINQL